MVGVIFHVLEAVVVSENVKGIGLDIFAEALTIVAPDDCPAFQVERKPVSFGFQGRSKSKLARLIHTMGFIVSFAGHRPALLAPE